MVATATMWSFIILYFLLLAHIVFSAMRFISFLVQFGGSIFPIKIVPGTGTKFESGSGLGTMGHSMNNFGTGDEI